MNWYTNIVETLGAMQKAHQHVPVSVVERSCFGVSFKYFLEMATQEDVINSSSLTKFRKLEIIKLFL